MSARFLGVALIATVLIVVAAVLSGSGKPCRRYHASSVTATLGMDGHVLAGKPATSSGCLP
jgi:hypothetical protein